VIGVTLPVLIHQCTSLLSLLVRMFMLLNLKLIRQTSLVFLHLSFEKEFLGLKKDLIYLAKRCLKACNQLTLIVDFQQLLAF
jgi:hypothetical protein